MVAAFVLFYVSQGRGYYTGPIYPILLAGGAVALQELADRLSPRPARGSVDRRVRADGRGGYGDARAATAHRAGRFGLLAVYEQRRRGADRDGRLAAAGGEVAKVYRALPEAERAATGIVTANYGEAGAIDLYGPALGLPNAISGVNSYWLRGYGDPPPEHLILVGFDRGSAERSFKDCSSAGMTPNPYKVANEESQRPVIYYCRTLRRPWSESWKWFRSFG